METVNVQQLKRGSLEMILLYLIAYRNCSYGYAIIETLNKMGNQFFRNLQSGTVYPILYRLENDGLIIKKDSGDESRAKRYCITEKGESKLRDMISIWHDYIDTVENILGGDFYEKHR